MKVEQGQLKSILTNELGYGEASAEAYSGSFPELHEKLEGPMKKWLENRTVEDVEVEGVSLKEAMEAQRGEAKFLHAIQGLNDLLTRDLSSEEREALKLTLKTRMPLR